MASATYSNIASPSSHTRRHSIPSLPSASHFSSSSAAPPFTGAHRLTLIARARLEKFQGQDTITLPDVVVDDPQLPQFQVPEDEDLIRGDGNGIPHSHSPLSLLDFEIGDRRAQRESSQSSGVVLPVLVESTYRASTIPYRFPSDDPREATPAELSWINLFANSIPSFRKRAESDETVSDAHIRAEKFALRYSEILEDLKKDPQSHGGPPDCILLCRLREQVLRELGFRDIFKRVKEEENAKAMALFEAVVRHHDAIKDEAARVENLVKGIFAGNIFDLGSAQLEELFAKDGMSFQATCQNLLPRPWVIDDLDKFVSKWSCRSWKKVVIFVDNSGVDIILGILPFARELLRRGAQVVLAANDLPSVNDVTYTKLIEIIAKLKDEKGTLLGVDASNLVIANSGNDLPVIDLTRVSQELAYLASDADLVVLEGMGRGIETNLYAQFRCDSLNIAMVKHPEVAQFLGGRLYDCVIKYNEFSY